MSYHAVRARAGVTLLEVLIVTAILAVLLALLAPAVQRVREAAARAQCQNHLRQLGLACHKYHDTYGVFPHGGHHEYPECGAHLDLRDSEWSWAYHLLPFLDQEHVYRASREVVDQTPIPLYYCPSRRPPAPVFNQAKISYAGNAGTNLNNAGLDGVIIRGPVARIRMGHILDGTTYTVLVGEKRLNAAQFGLSNDDNEPYNRPGWNDDFEVYRRGDVPPARDFRNPVLTSPSQGFGSAHPYGFNCVFADGSVRHVRYGVQLSLWQRACVRDDGEAIDLNNF